MLWFSYRGLAPHLHHAHAGHTQAGFRTEEIQQAQAALVESQIAEKEAQNILARQASLVGGGGTSQQNLESAQAALDGAQQRVKLAEAKLKLLEAGFRPYISI